MGISADSTIYDLLKTKPESAEVLFKFGMGCIGCAIAQGETIREAAMAHGIPLDELLSALDAEQSKQG
jgi:hybrid cluster-associated redox disulfide protein